MQFGGSRRKRRRLTQTQLVIVVLLGVVCCLVFGVLGWVLLDAFAPAAPAISGEPGGAQATASLSASTPTPTPIPPPALAAGWTVRGQTGEGFTLALPESYVELDLNAETMDAALDPLREQSPNMPEDFMSGWTTEGYRSKGLKLAAIKIPTADAPDYAAVDVTCHPLDDALTLDAAVREVIHRYPGLGVGILSNERVTLPAGEAEVLALAEGSDDPSTTTQYLLIKDKMSCFVTFSCDADVASAYAPTFVQIIETFRWSE
jgi:hypothetical protein